MVRPAPDDPEAIALRVHQIAATAAVLAEAATQSTGHGESLSHALYLLEACLLDVEARIETLPQGVGPNGSARRHKASGK